MIALVLDVVSWACLLAGGGFLLAGGIGLVRLPDFYTRLHAASVIDTLGVALILAGLMIQAGVSPVTVKLALIIVFVVFTGPTATHAVAQSAFVGGLKPWRASPEPAENDSAEDGPSTT